MPDENKSNNGGPAAPASSLPNSGNASNPAPGNNSLNPSPGNQLLDEKAEKYLREVASIEDLPDAQDQKEMDETLQQHNKEKE